MLRDIFMIAVGALVMRYIILHTDNYKQKEALELDKLRENVHELIKKYNPTADDMQVGTDVLETVK